MTIMVNQAPGTPARDWAYSSTCDVSLPPGEVSRGQQLASPSLTSPEAASSSRVSSYDTIDRYLCLCLEGTLLEFDLETSTCLREIRAAKDLVCLRYLNNKKRDKSRRRVVGIGRDGYVRCFDLVTGGSVALAFALKKSQTLEGPAQDGVLAPLRVSLAPSYSHAGCFWSIGESRSVYWI